MRIDSPAKINLLLQVLGKRPDNYHDIFTLMCCIGLYDTLTLVFGASQGSDGGDGHIAVSCTAPGVPQDASNLAHRAARLFFQRLCIRDSVAISITKKIPVGAGLGGGSSNAAAVLKGLNTHYGNPLTTDELMKIGREIGADVPFFIFQRPAIGAGIGDVLEPFSGLTPFQVVLIYPGFGVSTADVYKKMNLGLTKCKNKFKKNPFKQGYFEPARHLCNDLESITASEYPEIMEAKRALVRQGAIGALMSGSGSSVFGLFSDRCLAKQAEKTLSRKRNWQVHLADLLV